MSNMLFSTGFYVLYCEITYIIASLEPRHSALRLFGLDIGQSVTPTPEAPSWQHESPVIC